MPVEQMDIVGIAAKAAVIGAFAGTVGIGTLVLCCKLADFFDEFKREQGRRARRLDGPEGR